MQTEEQYFLLLTYRVSPNDMYKLGGEVDNIVRSHNYKVKFGQKAIGSVVHKFTKSAHVFSSFQTHACVKCELLYECLVGRHSLHLWPCQQKWTCRCSVVWGKIANKMAIKSSNVCSNTSELGGTWILQSRLKILGGRK